LKSGQYALGGFLAAPCPTIAEVVAIAGLDFIVVDTEHGGANFETVIDMSRAAASRGITTVVRIPDYDQKLIGRYLDNGIEGIQAPMVESAEEAAKIVAACKFEPMGCRGASGGRGSSWNHVPNYRAVANQETLVVCMCETKAGVENIEEIVKTPNLDVVFVGLGDLSQSLGCKSVDPPVQEAVERVLRACENAGVIPGIVCDGAEKSLNRIKQGFKYVTVLNDMRLLCTTTEGITKAIRAEAVQ
ncbi:MAG: hypothetical protein IJD04_09000, partial [Desulfovibrionaceae bacterium]|nr:hypothetical protein [Desulfovibrionaceae bacterium]